MIRTAPLSLPPDADTLVQAQSGCPTALEEVNNWVYNEGYRYFTSRVHSEPSLTWEEAEDLAGESLLEFQKALPRILTLPRYVRRMFRNNLVRHLTRKRSRRTRECLEDDQVGGVNPPAYLSTTTPRESGWTDQDEVRIRISRQRLAQADPITQTIWSYRLADEPIGYRQIGEILGMEEAALRMRFARFCKGVRHAVYRLEKRKWARYKTDRNANDMQYRSAK